MGHFIYPDTVERPAFFINPYKMDPVKQFAKHYENYRYIKFIFDSTNSGQERRQANKEIQIALKKMSYWENMPAAVRTEIEKVKKEIDKRWNSGT
jgi:hypothetical protein